MVYHYVYRITNIYKKQHYYGVRTSKLLPIKDIGIKYFSSSNDKDFIKDQKENPQNYKYKVIKTFKDRETALKLEIKLHNRFDVAVNESFYNRSKQTTTKFDTTGLSLNKGQISHNKGKKMSNEQKKKISESLKGRKRPKEVIEKMSLALKGIIPPNKGKKMSDEQKKKISESLKGDKNVRYGVKHSEETKEKMRKPKEKVKCPYCDKIGGISQMKRWHFDNCKFKREE